MRFFRALDRDPDKQLVYYQVSNFILTDSSILIVEMKPGIGTYNKRQYHTRTFSAIASAIDKAVALHLNDHVKDGCALSTRHF